MFPSLEEFLSSKGFKLVDKRNRLWFEAVHGRVDEETAITLAYQHWTVQHPEWIN